MKFKISPCFILLLSIAAYKGYGLEIAVTMGIILLHELGHLLALIAVGARIHSIRLGVFGAVIIHGTVSRWEGLCAAAGPLVNGILCFVPASVFFHQVNLALLLYNLLPIFPLDGGRILQWYLLRFFSHEQAAKRMVYVRYGVLFAAVFLGIYLSYGGKFGVYPLLAAIMLLIRCHFLTVSSAV